MLTWEEDVEATALYRRGWTISAIARHLGHDRKTIRAYLMGQRRAGQRRSSGPDALAPYLAYLAQRLGDDPHVWASVLYAELVELGYRRSYPTLVRQLRQRRLRPHCEACQGVKGRATIELDHPPGEELQWDWLELPETPWGQAGHVLVGALAFSGRIRAVLADATDQAHLIEAIDGVLRRLGGTARCWRVDRMASVVHPQSGRLQASFVPVAKHYGVTVVACPPRRANRKGVVEKAIDYLTQRWWRTAQVATLAEAQASLDRFCQTVADRRPRSAARLPAELQPPGQTTGQGRSTLTVAELARLEGLLGLPADPYPAAIQVTRTVGASSLVSFRGNRYSIPPGLEAAQVLVRHRLGSGHLEIHSASGSLLAAHRLVPAGAGQLVRAPQHHAALQAVVLDAFTTRPPCRRKANRPPSPQARHEAARLLAALDGQGHGEVTVDLARYERLATLATTSNAAADTEDTKEVQP